VQSRLILAKTATVHRLLHQHLALLATLPEYPLQRKDRKKRRKKKEEKKGK